MTVSGWGDRCGETRLFAPHSWTCCNMWTLISSTSRCIGRSGAFRRSCGTCDTGTRPFKSIARELGYPRTLGDAKTCAIRPSATIHRYGQFWHVVIPFVLDMVDDPSHSTSERGGNFRLSLNHSRVNVQYRTGSKTFCLVLA